MKLKTINNRELSHGIYIAFLLFSEIPRLVIYIHYIME